MRKNVSILGSTGSIGTQTLNIIRRYPEKFNVVGLTANSNVELLLKQAEEFKPQFIGITDVKVAAAAQSIFKKLPAEFAAGEDALVEAASLNAADIVVVAVVGMCGLKSVLAAAENGKTIALANKESLVAGGEIVMKAVADFGAKLLPVDSEHSAVWQALRGGGEKDLARIILTASGGAFYGKTKEQLSKITPLEATKHPNWSMGKKITVDSSTMMNKGLEIIEARWLFGTENIDYIIHRESIIHSMIEYKDGSILAQMSYPNMELPISVALGFPGRLENDIKKFDFAKNLSFCLPDEENFPLPKIAKQCMKKGGSLPCVMNAANEAAVDLFLNGKIGFNDIEKLILMTLEKTNFVANATLDDIICLHEQCIEELKMDYKTLIGA